MCLCFMFRRWSRRSRRRSAACPSTAPLWTCRSHMKLPSERRLSIWSAGWSFWKSSWSPSSSCCRMDMAKKTSVTENPKNRFIKLHTSTKRDKHVFNKTCRQETWFSSLYASFPQSSVLQTKSESVLKRSSSVQEIFSSPQNKLLRQSSLQQQRVIIT